jgi:predicted nucleic acid-binding protein
MPDTKELGFVDTNVLVYGFEKGDSPKKLIAKRLLSRLIDEDGLRVSTQVLQELYVTLTRKAARPCSSDEALAVMDDLTAWPVTAIDYTAIRSAARLADRSQISFWDALVVVAAASAGAAVLYTEHLNDGQQILGVRISNPFRAGA